MMPREDDNERARRDADAKYKSYFHINGIRANYLAGEQPAEN